MGMEKMFFTGCVKISHLWITTGFGWHPILPAGVK